MYRSALSADKISAASFWLAKASAAVLLAAMTFPMVVTCWMVDCRKVRNS